MTETTSLTRVTANPKVNSLKTTVPMTVIKILELKHKDKLNWEIIPHDNGYTIHITKAE